MIKNERGSTSLFIIITYSMLYYNCGRTRLIKFIVKNQKTITSNPLAAKIHTRVVTLLV